jgi:competence ComEA-like helix-hairpin-helix protein
MARVIGSPAWIDSRNTDHWARPDELVSTEADRIEYCRLKTAMPLKPNGTTPSNQQSRGKPQNKGGRYGKTVLAFVMWFALSVLAMAAVNINTATKEELTSIKGIGEKRAQDIIDYRTKNGNFKSVDDLERVPGIGPGLMKQIRPQLTTTGKTVIDQPAEKAPRARLPIQVNQPRALNPRKANRLKLNHRKLMRPGRTQRRRIPRSPNPRKKVSLAVFDREPRLDSCAPSGLFSPLAQ